MIDSILTPQMALVLIGLVLVASELLVGIEAGFDLVLIGTILIIGGVIGNLSGDMTVAIIVSIILTAVYVFFGRRIVRQKLNVPTKKTNIDNMLGKEGLVLRKITPHNPGLIKIEDEQWRASAKQTILAKQKARVASIDGVTLLVEKVV